MVSAVSIAKFSCNAAAKMYKHVPGSTNPCVVSVDGGTTQNWLPMMFYDHFILGVLNHKSNSNSGPTLIEIVGAVDATGTSAQAIVSKSLLSTHAGDFCFLEALAIQMREVSDAAGLKLTHITGRITCSNAGDECGVWLERAKSHHPQAGLTVDAVQ